MASELFSSVDAAWLHIDRPTNMAVIVGVMMFDTPISLPRLQKLIEERLLIYDRFRQRVKEPTLGLGLPRWEFDPHFDWSYHLKLAHLPGAGDDAELQKLAGEMMSQPLDPQRPLWQIHYVDNYGAGCALVARLHHCLADGLALVQVLFSLTDSRPDAADVRRPPHAAAPASSNIFRPVERLFDSTATTMRLLARESLLTLAHPSRVTQALGVGALGFMATSKLLLLSPDHATSLKGKCNVEKRATWSRPIPLNDIKQVGQAMQGTVNDVLLATVTGALRRYLEQRGEAVGVQVNIRAMVPVSIRAAADFDKLGNQFGLVILSLPLGVRDPIERIKILKRRMDEIKDTPEAFVAFSILGLMGVSPLLIERVITDIFANKTSAVMTNVPGPGEPIYLAGQKLKSLMFWVPRAGNIGLGVSILSYAGDVYVGIASDAGLIPDPDRVIDCFRHELAEMLGRTQPDQPSRSTVEPVPPTAEPAQIVEQCQAITHSGQRCKNRALPQSAYCRVHAKQIPLPA